MTFKKIPSRGIPELDTLRFVSVTLVITHHLFFKSNPIFEWLSIHAYVGVDIFFTLSGFIITKGLMREWDTKGGLSLKSFWVRRMFRLWPAWLFTLVISSIAVSLIARNDPITLNALKSKWWHYFLHFGNYSHAFIGKVHTLFSHFWSLAVEEHFYIIWPFFFICIQKYKKSIYFIVPLSIIIPYLFRVSYKMQGYENIVNTFSTHTRIDSIFIGCFLALFINNFPKIKSLGLEVMGWILSLFIMYVGLELKFYDGSYWLSQSAHFFRSVATFLIIYLLVSGKEHGIRRLWRNSLLSKLGVLSYSAYLLHFLFNTFLFVVNKRLSLNLSQPVLMLIACTLIYIPAYLSFNFVEYSLDKYKARFS